MNSRICSAVSWRWPRTHSRSSSRACRAAASTLQSSSPASSCSSAARSLRDSPRARATRSAGSAVGSSSCSRPGHDLVAHLGAQPAALVGAHLPERGMLRSDRLGRFVEHRSLPHDHQRPAFSRADHRGLQEIWFRSASLRIATCQGQPQARPANAPGKCPGVVPRRCAFAGRSPFSAGLVAGFAGQVRSCDLAAAHEFREHWHDRVRASVLEQRLRARRSASAARAGAASETRARTRLVARRRARPAACSSAGRRTRARRSARWRRPARAPGRSACRSGSAAARA